MLARLPRGELVLHVRAGENTDDERAGTIQVSIAGDVTLAPALPRVAGSLALRGKILIDGKPPGGPDYASSVRVECGPALTRYTTVDAKTGGFTVAHLPARRCVLHATSDRDRRWQRDLTVQPGSEVTVELTPG